jgi:hypothetical protein
MALVTCPDCGASISSSAPACPHCGRPADRVTPAVAAGPHVGAPAPIGAIAVDLFGWGLVAAPIVGAAALLVVPFGTPVLVASVVTILACAILAFFDARALGMRAIDSWVPMIIIWIVGYPLHLRARARSAPNKLILGGFSMLVFLGSSAIASEVGARVDASCHVSGDGEVACSFVNLGWSPGSACVLVGLFNSDHSSIKTEDPLCSGRLWPSGHDDAKGRIEASPITHCLGMLPMSYAPKWPEYCRVNVVRITR